MGGIIGGVPIAGGELPPVEGTGEGADTRPTAKPTMNVAMIDAAKSPGFMFVGSADDV
jgi:hypothetical protein